MKAGRCFRQKDQMQSLAAGRSLAHLGTETRPGAETPQDRGPSGLEGAGHTGPGWPWGVEVWA